MLSDTAGEETFDCKRPLYRQLLHGFSSVVRRWACGVYRGKRHGDGFVENEIADLEAIAPEHYPGIDCANQMSDESKRLKELFERIDQLEELLLDVLEQHADTKSYAQVKKLELFARRHKKFIPKSKGKQKCEGGLRSRGRALKNECHRELKKHTNQHDEAKNNNDLGYVG